MTREDLLHLASQQPMADAAALDLAGRLMSVDAIVAATAKIETDVRREATAQSRWVMTAAVMILLSLGSIGAGVFRSFAPAAERSPFDLVVCSAVFLLFVCGMMVERTKSRWERENHKMAFLRPIAGTDLCREALRYLESGDSQVEAWQDIALADRGCLYAFDVEVLRCLHDCGEQVRFIDAARRANEEACRKVHRLYEFGGAGASTG